MKSRTIYLIIILFLTVTNIVTVISGRSDAEKDAIEDLPVISKPQAERMSFFWGELGLTQDQRDDVALYNKAYNETAEEITLKLTDLRHEIVSEVSKEEPDRDYLETVIDQFGDHHAELKRATVDFYYQLSSVCSPEQKKRLEFMFRDMLDPDGAIYGRGRGGQGRRGDFRGGQGRGRGQGSGRGWENGRGWDNGRGRGRNSNFN